MWAARESEACVPLTIGPWSDGADACNLPRMAIKTRFPANNARRVRFAFGRTRSAVTDVSVDPPVELIPEVEFVAYAADCAISGFIRLEVNRLSDLLNGSEEFELRNVLVDDFSGTPPAGVSEVLVKREELLVVHATGPRGNPALRRPTRQHPVIAVIGPYQVSGYVHAMPGAPVLASLQRRGHIVPLSDASIDYVVGGSRQRRRVETLLINRDHIDSIVEAHEDDVRVLDLPVDYSGRLVKDFTDAPG
jgi:hypothetical protein